MKIKKKISPISVVVFIVLMVYGLALLYMVFWALMTSLKDVDEYLFGNSLALPSKLVWGNYAKVYEKFYVRVMVDKEPLDFNLLSMFGNSVFYAGISALIGAFVPFLVAYITAKYNYWWCKVLNSMVIILLALPIIGGTPSVISMLDRLKLYDTFFGLYILKFNFLNVYYLIYYASWLGIPNDYREAASIDGASEMRIMLSVMFPMMVKMFTTVLLIMFVDLWNDYQTPLVYAPSIPVLARGVYSVARDTSGGGEIANTPMRMATTMMVLVPVMLVFVAFNKQLMGSISMGGLKE